MSYDKLRAILNHAMESDSLPDLLKRLGEDSAFSYRKKQRVLIRRQRKQYIDKAVKLGLLDENYQLSDLGKEAINNFNNIISQIIFDMEFNGKKLKDLLFTALANTDIPTTERVHEKFTELQVNIPIQQLRNYLNILAKCGVLQKNRKYTYTLPQVGVKDFESILKVEFNSTEKDPSGLIWYEQCKELIQKKYNLSAAQFEELFSELKKKKPRLISLQRSRTKTWLRVREI